MAGIADRHLRVEQGFGIAEAGSLDVTPCTPLVRLNDMITSHAGVSQGLSVGRRIGIAGLAALLGGVLVLGIGGRLAMRLSGAMAITNDANTRFMLTGDGFRIGHISLDGSLGLVLFGGVFGSIIAGGYWALLKDHLPRKRRLLLAGVAAAAVGGNAFVRTDNIDFVILQPVIMNVVLYPVLCAIAGVTIVALDHKIEGLARTSTILSSALLTAFGMVGAAMVGTLMIVSVLDDPWPALELAALSAVTVPLWVREIMGREPVVWLTRSAGFVAGAVILAEWMRLVRTAALILQ